MNHRDTEKTKAGRTKGRSPPVLTLLASPSLCLLCVSVVPSFPPALNEYADRWGAMGSASNHQADRHEALRHLLELLAVQPLEQTGAHQQGQEALHQPRAPA